MYFSEGRTFLGGGGGGGGQITSQGGQRDFLRKLLATCNFQRGFGPPVSPLCNRQCYLTWVHIRFKHMRDVPKFLIFNM